jgi:hypothetical protein
MYTEIGTYYSFWVTLCSPGWIVRPGWIVPPTKLNSMALVRERTIPTERPPPVGEVSANFVPPTVI